MRVLVKKGEAFFFPYGHAPGLDQPERALIGTVQHREHQGNSSHPTTDRRMWDADIHDKIRELNLFRAILLLR